MYFILVYLSRLKKFCFYLLLCLIQRSLIFKFIFKIHVSCIRIRNKKVKEINIYGVACKVVRLAGLCKPEKGPETHFIDSTRKLVRVYEKLKMTLKNM